MQNSILTPAQIIQEIKISPAMTLIQTAFAPRAMALVQHHNLLWQWFEITRAFYLAGLSLPALIGRDIRSAIISHDQSEHDRLSRINHKVVGILRDDGGHCDYFPAVEKLPGWKTRLNQVHYEMFYNDIIRPFGLPPAPLSDHTQALVEGLYAGFESTTERGFGWILVVEIIARNIVVAMNKYLRKIQNEGRSFLNEEQLFYCTFHILLEQRHADDVSATISDVASTKERMQKLTESVRGATQLFGDFWRNLAQYK